MHHRSALCVALAAFALAQAGVARGADRDPAAAQALFEQGRADAAAGRYATACPRFEESFRLDPSVGTLLNMADCAEHVGHVAAALAHFTDALAQLRPDDDRLSYVKERISRLKPRVPRLEIDSASTEPMTILRDAVEVGPASRNTSLPVEPGPHVIVVRAPGRKDREIHVDLGEGAEQRVQAEPGDPLPSAANIPNVPNAPLPAAAASPAATTTASSSSTGRGAWPWLVGGVGAAGIAVGAVAGMLALGDAAALRQLCANHTCASSDDFSKASGMASRGKTEATISTAGFSVGLVGAAVAAYLWLRPSSEGEHGAAGGAPRASRGPATSAWAAPWAGPTDGGLAVGAHFQ
jgi:hypothetical protein